MPDCKNLSIMPRQIRICWIFVPFLLASCASQPGKDKASFQVKAAEQWHQPVAAELKSYRLRNDRISLRLLNADTFLQSDNNKDAQVELDLINQAELSIEQRSKFNLLAAQIDLNKGDAEHALRKLKLTRPVFLSKADKVNYYQSLAFAQVLTGNVLQGVISRIKLGRLIDQLELRQANMAAIIDMLSLLPEEILSVQAGIETELRGWMALAKVLNQRDQVGTDMNGLIQQWRLEYPEHGADPEYLLAYLSVPKPTSFIAEERSGQTLTGEGFIAVLLPASGPYAPAGKVVKEGIQAAHRVAASSAPQLPLRFYDSAYDDISVVYHQAVAEGARKIVGPLVKEQIKTLAWNADLTMPVLALNHVEDLSQHNLYQFGLSPIDEAEALAAKAMGNGRQSAWILVPNTLQGQRVADYLDSAWRKHGGTVAGVHHYDPRQHDISRSFNQMLASSRFPSGQQPSRALLLSANDELARELAPQLKYHQNTDIAVYAMPTIYSGRPAPVQDADLGSFSFCDIPWLFSDYYNGPLSQFALQNSWVGLPESLVRLVALGIDAYNLLAHLDEVAIRPYSGATGRLSLSADNRIVRNLVCAEFKGGIPIATGFAE